MITLSALDTTFCVFSFLTALLVLPVPLYIPAPWRNAGLFLFTFYLFSSLLFSFGDTMVINPYVSWCHFGMSTSLQSMITGHDILPSRSLDFVGELRHSYHVDDYCIEDIPPDMRQRHARIYDTPHQSRYWFGHCVALRCLYDPMVHATQHSRLYSIHNRS